MRIAHASSGYLYLVPRRNTCEQFARAHREVFTGVDPAATCVEVSRLVSPEFLVEVEVDAVTDPA